MHEDDQNELCLAAQGSQLLGESRFYSFVYYMTGVWNML